MRDLWQRTLSYFGIGEDEIFENEYEDLDEEAFTAREPSTVRRIRRSPEAYRAERAASLRSVAAPASRVSIIEPKDFDDAQLIADKFKTNIPVIINLQGSDAELSKRLLAFGSGLTYGLNGGMQRVAEKVFLLTPSNVEVSAEEKRRLRRERGFFNQLIE